MSRELRAARWYTRQDASIIGIIAVIGPYDEWVCYIGVSSGITPEEDMRTILFTGEKMRIDDATHFFPDLPIEKYRV